MPWSQMPGNSGGGDFNLLTALIILLVSAWGGLVQYLIKMKSSVNKHFDLVDLISDIVISMFSGIIVGCIAYSLNISPLATMALAGMAGHSGCKTVYFLGRIYEKKLKALSKRFLTKGD